MAKGRKGRKGRKPPKKPSGAEFRRRRRDEKLQVDRARAGGPAGLAEWERRYEEVGPPPVSGVERVEWANRICALVIYEQLTAPSLRTTPERKLVLEGVRTLGMTAVKALYESRLKRIESTLYGGRAREALDDADGLEPDPTAGPARPI